MTFLYWETYITLLIHFSKMCYKEQHSSQAVRSFFSKFFLLYNQYILLYIMYRKIHRHNCAYNYTYVYSFLNLHIEFNDTCV